MRGSPLSRQARRTGSAALRLLVVAVVALVLPLVPLGRAGLAEEEGEGGPIAVGDFRLLEPVKDQLGASSWMMASGYDPRFWNIPSGAENRAEVDWGALGVGLAAPRGGVAFAPPVPFRSAAPAFSRNLIVTRQLGLFPLQTEPHIAVDPNDPEHLVLGVIDYNFPSMSTYTSFDGGETWSGPNQVRYFQDDLAAAGDPVIGFDREGNVYIVFISLGIDEYRIGSLLSAAQVSSIAIAKSTDDGLTWQDAVSTSRSAIETTSNVDASGRERGQVAIDFLDKPWIAIGPSKSDPERDAIYVAYTEFKTRYSLLYADEVPFLTSPVTETTIRVVSSEDGGQTWSEPTAVSPTVFQAEGASEEGEGEGGAATAPGGFSVAPAPPETPVAETPAATDLEDAGAMPAAATPAATPLPNRSGGENENAPARVTDDGSVRTQEEGPLTGSESNQTVQGAQPAVLSDGTLVVSYLDTTNDGVMEGLATIMVATSPDGGKTFETPRQATVMREIAFRPRNSTFRWWGAAFPQITVGPDDAIYILTTAKPVAKPTDDGDIIVLRSFDRGMTWEDPVTLNQDDTDRIQFFPSIDVSPDGVVHAMWGDMRDDPAEARYNIYYSVSEDRGATWGFDDPTTGLHTPDTRVTDFASNALKGFPGGRFLGDYFSIAAADQDVYLVWADTRLGEFQGPNQQIGFARRTAIAPPELFLNPPSGAAGRDVTIQGFDFQPDSNISIDVGGITVTNLRSNERGEFTTNIYMPVTGEGPRNVTAYDETGNVATASFFTEFGFDSIARALQDLSGEQPGAPAATPIGGQGFPDATPVGGRGFPDPTPTPDLVP